MIADTRTLPLPGIELARAATVGPCPWLTAAELEALSFELDQLEQLDARAKARRARRKLEQLWLFA